MTDKPDKMCEHKSTYYTRDAARVLEVYPVSEQKRPGLENIMEGHIIKLRNSLVAVLREMG